MTDSSSGQSGRLNADAAETLRVETEFLSGVEANLEAAKGGLLAGDRWRAVRDDESDALRAMMASRQMYDRELLKQLPHNRRIVLQGSQRRWLLFRRPTEVAIATVVAPFEHLLTPESTTAPPVTLGELTAHVRGLVGEAKVPHVVGVCSPSGFADDVRETRLDMPNVTIVLVEPRAGGGWTIATPGGTQVSENIRKLYDPEAISQKVTRALREIEHRRVDLLTGGLSAASIAAGTGLPEGVVMLAFKKVAGEDTELRVTRRSGHVVLYRGAPSRSQESSAMNVVDRIRALFSSEGDEAQKINVLAERRANLAQRRDRLYEDIGKLEKREAELLNEGRTSKSQVTRRRLAAQLGQLRKDIARQNTTANMLNQQINILSTDIHNLTLIQQGQMASLPNTEELTENAVKAEEMLETLRADADMVAGLETGLADVATSDEELAILKEFDEPEAPMQTASADSAAEREVMREFDQPQEEARPEKNAGKQRADPEA